MSQVKVPFPILESAYNIRFVQFLKMSFSKQYYLKEIIAKNNAVYYNGWVLALSVHLLNC